MGSIIRFATQKGGAGKTTLARVLSADLAHQGWQVAVIDADPNRGFMEWAGLYTGPSMTFRAEPDEKELANLPADLAETHDVVLVAIGAADGVIIPCMPDRGSVREAEQTAEWVRNLSRSTRREIRFRVVMTGFDPRRSADRHALDQAKNQLLLPFLDAVLSDRTAYQASSWSGAAPTDGIIGHEAAVLSSEIMALGWLSRPAR